MAIVRNAANTLRRGKIGETTYYTSVGRQIARQALNNSNYGESARRSLAQQTRRVKWANLVNFYKLCSNWMPKAFESKKPGQTDYNKFMQLNVNTQRVALTRDQAVNGGCVVDAFAITQGTIKSCNLRVNVSSAVSDLFVPSSFVFATGVTVGNLATALISVNNHVKAGMQLSVLEITTTGTTSEVPRTNVNFYEVVLDPTSNETLATYIPEGILMKADNLSLVMDGVNHGIAGALVLSEKTDSGLKVSSETLCGYFSEAIQFSAAEQVTAAINSYGVDKEVILSPDAAEPTV